MIFLVLFLNALRFIGLNFSPPGFYSDEAAGAAQVLCIQQTGHDFFNQHLPLFSSGLGGGFYTTPFLYGEVVWTSIFGSSVASFRGFLAFVTSLTVLFLYQWTLKRAGKRVALFTALAASVLPWAFQFSRIAWDPPLCVLFLVLALWATQWEWCAKRMGIFPGIFLALAAYSYPPMRVSAALFWILLPGRTWKQTIRDLGIFAVVCIPLFMRSMDADFIGRGKMLAIWSSYPMNPYANANVFELFGGFVKQFLEHFSFSFLWVEGDANLRHSIRSVGMLSWLDGLAVVAVLAFSARRFIWKKKMAWSNGEAEVLIVALIGIAIAVMPAALTWEGVPHALRAIAAWPFFALFTGLMLARLESLAKSWIPSAIFSVVAVGFFGFYLNHYFTDYVERAQPYFQSENAPLAQAYHQMTVNGRSCEELRTAGVSGNK